MKGDTPIFVGVGVCIAAVVGIVLWGRSRSIAPGLAQPSSNVIPLGLFPDLKVGDGVLVDSKLANLPAPFNAIPQQVARVDMILSDPTAVSVRCGINASVPPFFSGTIPRLAILKVLPGPGDLQI